MDFCLLCACLRGLFTKLVALLLLTNSLPINDLDIGLDLSAVHLNALLL